MRDLENCKSVDSLGHVNYTVPVMILVSLCLHVFFFVCLFVCLFVYFLLLLLLLFFCVQYIFPVGCSCFPVIVDFILFIAAVFLWFVSLSLSFITSSANKQVSLYFPLIICLFPGVSQWFLHTILFYPVVLWLSVNIWSYLVVLPLGVTILSYLAVLALDVAILSYPVILLLAVT